MQHRLKSKIVWASIAAQLISILLLTGVITVSESETLNQIIAAVLELCTLFGVLNNPTTRDTF